ncbi:hypothetical protein PYW07_012597 [Mythimna separata]|uniref:Uncharacterized protein n=1 Tax=Mythimna separata TaxID=271217 RepID=A0AAD8DKP4_MYTSE|nr:hypothetical protein PYW07_012597 [Mythimna separata]
MVAFAPTLISRQKILVYLYYELMQRLYICIIKLFTYKMPVYKNIIRLGNNNENKIFFRYFRYSLAKQEVTDQKNIFYFADTHKKETKHLFIYLNFMYSGGT